MTDELRSMAERGPRPACYQNLDPSVEWVPIVETMMSDLNQLARRDGCVAAACAIEVIQCWATILAAEAKPIDMVLPCPRCGELHIDAPEPANGWENPPHKSHMCHECGLVWRPADVPTNGVAAVKTRGENDTFPY